MGAVTLKLNNHDSGKHHPHDQGSELSSLQGKCFTYYFLFLTQDGIVHYEYTLNKKKL